MKTSFLKKYLKQLGQNKFYTLINIFGFAVSLMFVILLTVYIQQELSVDTFNVKKDRIYRLTRENWSGYPPPMGQWLMDKYPDIENYTRLSEQSAFIEDCENNKLNFNFLLVDSSFFNIFSFKVKEGARSDLLKRKNDILLTESFAKKLFGNETDLIGKEVKVNDHLSYTINGIIEDLPENTHFQKCDALLNFPALEDIWGASGLMDGFGNSSFGLYFLESENGNLPSREPEILELFLEEFWVYKSGYAKVVNFEPLVDCYFSESSGTGIKSNSRRFINILAIIVMVILIISLINYINLTIAQSGLRNKEIATKLMLGSTKIRLYMKFILESTFLCLIALIIAIVMSIFAEPVFNNLLDTNIHLISKFNFILVLFLLVTIIVVGIISGIVPAFVITRIRPIEIIKGTIQAKNKVVYSKALIAVQFAVVIILLICTWIIIRQTNFAQDYDTGFSKDQIMVIQNNINPNKKAALKEELTSITGVENIAYVQGNPTDGGNNWSFTYHDVPLSFQIFRVDTEFFSIFDMEISETGVPYTKEAIWLNETAIKETELGENPTYFKDFNNEPPIKGIVKDFNIRDIHQKIGPVMIFTLNENEYAWSILVKISDKDVIQTVDKIKTTYKDFSSGLPFEWEFVNERMQSWYEKEVKTSHILSYFAFLSIIISTLGILAMSLFYIQNKIKEIGIRKVNGAGSGEIIMMLNSDFILWVILAFFVACPVSWFAMSKWLESFAYKVNIDWWIFAMVGIAALIAAVLTISIQSWRASIRNPVEALRYE